MHPKLVRALLGHSSIEMSMDTYSHVMPEMSGAALRAMDAALEVRPEDGSNLVSLEDPGEAVPGDGDEAAEG